MAIPHGRYAAVYFNATDLSGYLRSATMSATCDTADTSTFGASAKTYVAGQIDWTASYDGLYDPAVLSPEASLGVDGGVLSHCPGGRSLGDRAWLSSVIGTSYDVTAATSDAVSFSWGVQRSGPTGSGYILHPMSKDTNTTTGSSRDDAAATSTGWTAHIHCTLVDGGSWVVKLQDSADNSSWADVTGGAFAALTGAGSQRLVSAAGATLRRYVRYVATRTGGSAGNGITFFLGIARTWTV